MSAQEAVLILDNSVQLDPVLSASRGPAQDSSEFNVYVVNDDFISVVSVFESEDKIPSV